MPKKSKYKSVKFEYNGVTYDSTKEGRRAMLLDILLKRGAILNLKRQVRYTWIESNELGLETIRFKRSWIADFTYLDVEKGELIIEDVKGFRTTEYKKKKKIVEHLFGIKITEV